VRVHPESIIIEIGKTGPFIEMSPTLTLKRVEINAATTTRAIMVLNMMEETFIVSEAKLKNGWYRQRRDQSRSNFPGSR
jgi:hypothetical protein